MNGGQPNNGLCWTKQEDEMLMTYGPAVGYGVVASHDLGRSLGSGIRRAAFLRKFHPEFCAGIDRKNTEADAA